jgi:hypothetical protein
MFQVIRRRLKSVLLVQIWPAIWMLPENNTYGEWPLSGELWKGFSCHYSGRALIVPFHSRRD